MTYKAEPPTKKSDQLGFRPKRFWKAATVAEQDGGYAVHLDGRPVKTPQGRILTLPTRALAEGVVAEWAAVGEYLEYENMPLTRFGFAAVDRMDEVIDATVDEVLRYAETDLLCYPSQYPQALVAREDAAWLPVLKWADEALDLSFHQNKALIHKQQPPETLVKIQLLIEQMTSYERAGIMAAIPLFGSVVLALALWRGHLGAEAAFATSRVGEDFQSETWGGDEEATQRVRSMQAQTQSLEVWFKALA